MTEITVVHAPACHLCDDAEEAISLLATHLQVELRTVDFESEEGRRLVAEHRPAMNPLVLVDGAYFSSGRLPRRKLQKLLHARSVAEPAQAGR